jgi:dipeptidyl aminopeptidase/acylaminoacyl peptidase
VFLVGSTLAGFVFTQNTLHVPRKIRPAAGDPVEIRASDGVLLRASWFPKSDRCLMILHGVTDSRASGAGFAPVFLDAGYAVLAPDSRAHGESGGNLVTYGIWEKDDAIQWARWLKGQGCSKVFGLGESLGGATLLLAAAVSPEWEAIVVESVYADIEGAAEQRMRLYSASVVALPKPIEHAVAWAITENGRLYARAVYRLDLAKASPIRIFDKLQTPVLLIHGLNDNQTPPEHSKQLAQANPRARLWLVEGVGHESSYNHDPAEYRRRVFEWFDQR